MQQAEHVSFLMMGSRRTILKDRFADKKRPIYKSAVVLALPAIRFVHQYNRIESN